MSVGQLTRGGLQRLARLVDRPNLLLWLALLWALSLLARAHWLFLQRPYAVNVDEAYVLALGRRLVEGSWLPYVDGVSHRGPMMYWVGAWIALFGADGWIPMRIAAVLTFMVGALFTFLAGRAAGKPLAGVAGAIAVPVGAVLLMVEHDGIAFNGEALLNVFVMAAFWCLVHGLCGEERKTTPRWLAAAGALTMLGALSKQVAILTFLPFTLWVAAAVATRPAASARARWRLFVFYAGGAAAPLVLVVLRYLVAGQLGTFWYWLVRYNTEVYMFPMRHLSKARAIWDWMAANLVPVLLALTAVGWTLGRLVMAWVRGGTLLASYRTHGFSLTVALMSITSIVGAHLGMRGFGHYFLQAVPWLGLLAGQLLTPPAEASAEAPAAVRSTRHLFALYLLVLLPVVIVGELAWPAKRAAFKQSIANVQSPAVCAVVKQNAQVNEPILVWGFWPDAYVWCQRKPASRYVFTTFVAGFVPWFNHHTKQQDDALTVPGSRAQLIADLESSRAPVIVDAPGTMGGRPMRRYQELAAYLDAHYRWLTKVDQLDVYVRGKSQRRALFDFESPNLDPHWVLDGDAFRGTDDTHHPPQTPITGQNGQRFLNTFTAARGDAAIGSALSPPFLIDRNRLGFLVGGGRSCKVQLQIEGRPVLEQTGLDSEHLADVVWDVSAYRGKEARLALLDQATGPWGHLLFDRVELFEAP